MTYLTYEKSEASGAPVELYRFSSAGFLTPLLYTSNEDDVEYNFETYTAIPIKRSQPEHSREPAQRELTIELSRDNELAAKYISFVPPKTVWLTIYRYHRIDNQIVVFWQGRVRGVSWQGNIASLNCQPTDSMFARMGLRASYGSNCSHMLYDAGCKVSSALYENTASILNINGDRLTASIFATFPDLTPVPTGWWITGYIERVLTGDLRYIIGHLSDEITLLAAFEGLEGGELMKIYAGCDHAYTTCINKFANGINFGGFPFVPLKNPFEFKLA